MGLFEKKLCAICGKKKGLLGDTLKDGNHLCCDCSHKAFGVYEAFDVKTSDARALKPEECTLEDYKNLVAVREKQAQEVRQFHTDYSLGALHLDKRTGNLIFADPSDFKNMEKSITPQEHVEIINSCAAAAHCTVEKLIESAYSD